MFIDGAATKPVTAPIVVEVVEAPTRFSFRWGHADGVKPAAGNSVLVEFTLQPEGDSTRLRVVESGHVLMDWANDQKATYAKDHERGWQLHLGRLQDHFASR